MNLKTSEVRQNSNTDDTSITHEKIEIILVS